MPCLQPSLEQDGDLGPDAARARNRHSLSAARCAGCGVHPVLLGYALLCAAALLCSGTAAVSATEGPSQNPAAGPAVAANFPVASDARLAGDRKQTRFVLDLDRPIQFRAFTLADPYRVVVDVPQVDF